jgi:hypothetical protein
LRYRNDNVGDEVVIFSAKGLVVGNPHVNVQIARTATSHTNCTLAG